MSFWVERQCLLIGTRIGLPHVPDTFLHLPAPSRTFPHLPPGLYLPVELMDYGLALLAEQCGWGISSVLYMAINTNSQVGSRALVAGRQRRPGVSPGR